MLLAATVAAAFAWMPLPSATLARTEVAAARVGDSIYVAGGFVQPGRTTSAVERYDIRRRRWTRVRPMPLPLNHAVAVAYRGRLYVSGGYRAESSLSEPSRALLRYDPGTKRWGRLPQAPTPRAAHAAAIVRGRLYVAGGANDSGSLRSLEVYDFARRRWTSGPDFPGPARNHTTGVATGGRFYVLAGRDALEPRRGRALRPAPAALAAAPRHGHSARRHRLGAARRRAHRRVRRGELRRTGGETIAEVELFDPRTSRWRRLPDMRTPRHGLGGVALGNRVFAMEGGPRPGFAFSAASSSSTCPSRASA